MQYSRRPCIYSDRVHSSRPSYGSLPFRAPIEPYWLVNRTSLHSDISSLPPLPTALYAAPSTMSFADACLSFSMAQAADHNSTLSNQYRQAGRSAPCSSRPILRSSPVPMPRSAPMPLKSSIVVARQVGLQQSSPDYASPTTVRHNAFGSRGSSPPHSIQHNVGEASVTVGDCPRFSSRAVVAASDEVGIGLSRSPSISSQPTGSAKVPSPSPSSKPLSEPLPLSPQQSGSHSQSASNTVGAYPNIICPVASSLSAGGASLDVPEKREMSALKVLPNSLSIRRSRRARRHTLRSLTPSPPRQEPPEVPTWQMTR